MPVAALQIGSYPIGNTIGDYDGRALCQQLNVTEETKHIPVMMSAKTNLTDMISYSGIDVAFLLSKNLFKYSQFKSLLQGIRYVSICKVRPVI